MWTDLAWNLELAEQRAGKIHFTQGPAEMEIRMTLTVGDKIVYPGRGPCLVGAIVQKVVCGTSARFYRLTLLDGSNGELFVPVENFHDLHMRSLLDRSDIPELLGHLKTRAGVTNDLGTAKNWRQRQLDNLKLFRSGSIFDLADTVESLTQLSGARTLSPDERETLYRARKLLVCEISEVMDESKRAAEARIDSALEPPQQQKEPFTKLKSTRISISNSGK
ncbi:MAG TPA: CarD family transcriptional regulator [Candidatus Udaeobacter sp.]|nr:CarD family transcriptional regulator [Candidatus Udaeobacter sp.]